VKDKVEEKKDVKLEIDKFMSGIKLEEIDIKKYLKPVKLDIDKYLFSISSIKLRMLYGDVIPKSIEKMKRLKKLDELINQIGPGWLVIFKILKPTDLINLAAASKSFCFFLYSTTTVLEKLSAAKRQKQFNKFLSQCHTQSYENITQATTPTLQALLGNMNVTTFREQVNLQDFQPSYYEQPGPEGFRMQK